MTPEEQARDQQIMAAYEAAHPKPIESPTYNALFPNGMGRLNEEVHTIARCLCAQADAVREQTAELRGLRFLMECQLHISEPLKEWPA